MKSIENVIGVDLGGTNMRAALVVSGEITTKAARLVPKTDSADEVVNALVETIKEVYTAGVEAIGVGVPSLVKAKDGIVYDVQNIPSWKKIHLKEILEKEFNCPVYVNNDANCFAVGERVFGTGKQFDDFVGLITGTGLGAGIIKNGHLLPDQNCGAGEFGMIPYLDDNYEMYCSGQFFERRFKTDGGTLAQKAAGGDARALEAFAEYGQHLGKAVKTILFTVDPEAIVIGGSVAKSFDYYKEAMWKEISDYPYGFALENLKIVPSNMQEVAILGAAALCIDALS